MLKIEKSLTSEQIGWFKEFGALFHSFFFIQDAEVSLEKRNCDWWSSRGWNEPPERVYLASSSNRKRLILSLLLMILKDPKHEFFRSGALADPLGFFELIQAAFHNGNGDSQDESYLGTLFGVEVHALPQSGETHEPAATQVSEARAKAEDGLRQVRDRSVQARPPFSSAGDSKVGETLVISLDTLAYLLDGAGSTKRVGKPSGDPAYQANLPVGEAVEKYLEHYFPGEVTMIGVTVAALTSLNPNLSSLAATAFWSRVRAGGMSGVDTSRFDPEAAAGGLPQLFAFAHDQSYLDESSLARMWSELEREAGLSRAAHSDLEKLLALFVSIGVPICVILGLLTQAGRGDQGFSLGTSDLEVVALSTK